MKSDPFSLDDTIVAFGTPPIWLRVVERVVLIPVIAALAYEVLRLGQRFGNRGIFGLIYRPNLWLQSLTTRNPDDAQIEVAIAALQDVIAAEAGVNPHPLAPSPSRGEGE